MSTAKRRLPPIIGLPSERPVCVMCGKRLLPNVAHSWAKSHPYELERREFMSWKAYDGLFHSLSCARAFAVSAYYAGYRRRRQEAK